jgi:hypothetical protein
MEDSRESGLLTDWPRLRRSGGSLVVTQRSEGTVKLVRRLVRCTARAQPTGPAGDSAQPGGTEAVFASSTISAASFGSRTPAKTAASAAAATRKTYVA